jgi:hypothetical protein
VIARVERDAVLTPVQVVVRFDTRVLVIQLGVERPVRAEELADADGAEGGVLGQAIAVLEVVAGAAGQVPAIVELLRVGGLHEADTGEQCGTEQFLVHSGSAPLIQGEGFAWCLDLSLCRSDGRRERPAQTLGRLP